jgi:hypothetical protein
MDPHHTAAGDARDHGAPTDADGIAATLRELNACAIAVLRGIRLADPEKPTAPDKVGTPLEKVADAMTAAAECLIRLAEIRERQAAEVGPRRLDDVVATPLADTLAAIRRARHDVS